MSWRNRHQISIKCKKIYSDRYLNIGNVLNSVSIYSYQVHSHTTGPTREKLRQEEPAIRQAEADNSELERQLRDKRKVADSLQAQLNELKENRQGLKDTLVIFMQILLTVIRRDLYESSTIF